MTSVTHQRYSGVKTPMKYNLQTVRELKSYEKEMKEKGLIGWIMNTEPDNWKMMKTIYKLGGKPFDLSLNEKLVWFSKRINNGG